MLKTNASATASAANPGRSSANAVTPSMIATAKTTRFTTASPSMRSRCATSAAGGTTRRTTHAATNAPPTMAASRPMKAGRLIVSSRSSKASATAGSVTGTSAVAKTTATTASAASSPTKSAIATLDTIGDEADIRISASRKPAGSPSARAGVVTAQTRSGDTPRIQTTSAATSPGRRRLAAMADQSSRIKASASGITSVGTSSGFASAASGGSEESDQHAAGHELRGVAADERERRTGSAAGGRRRAAARPEATWP